MQYFLLFIDSFYDVQLEQIAGMNSVIFLSVQFLSLIDSFYDLQLGQIAGMNSII